MDIFLDFRAKPALFTSEQVSKRFLIPKGQGHATSPSSRRFDAYTYTRPSEY